MSQKTFWWKPTRILSYNCLFNFIVGNRGCGKGFGMTEMIIRKAIYEGKQFVHLRRTEVELKKAKDKFFDDMIDKGVFPGYSFRCRGDEYQCIELNPETNEPYDEGEWQTIGYPVYLSGARTQKSIPMPKVWIIWFDEFILPDKKMHQYLDDEVNMFLRLYDTIARMRDVIVCFVGNAESIINPYFVYFNLRIPYNTDICRIKEDIAFEMVDNPEFREARRNTRFGKLIDGTEYGEYAIDNSFGIEKFTDIVKLDRTAKYLFNINYNGTILAIYRSDANQQMIISLKADKTYPVQLDLTDSKGKINKLLISQRRQNYYLNALFQAFIRGFLFYESLKVKQIMEPVLCKLM